MKQPQNLRSQSIALMWDWIWPLSIIDGLFALFFVFAPHPSFLKLVVAGMLTLVTSHLAYSVRYRKQLARRWFLYHIMVGFNLIVFTIGLAALWGFRLRLPDDSLKFGMMLLGLVAVAGLTWRYYIPGLQPLLEADCRTDRFNLEKGTYSLRVLPSLYEFKIPWLRKATNVLLPFSGVLLAISAASSVHGRRLLRNGKDIFGGALWLIVAAFCVGGVAGFIHTYRFIRRWEKQTGRTMWIEGFEPGSSSN